MKEECMKTTAIEIKTEKKGKEKGEKERIRKKERLKLKRTEKRER